MALALSSIRSDVDIACGEPSSKNEKADSAGDTRPWSRLGTVKVWPPGVGKSFAVGVGTRGEGGEIDLDLMDEGMLQLHVWGLEYAGLTEAMQGLFQAMDCVSGCSARAFSRVGGNETVGMVKWANRIYSKKKERELLARCI